MKNLHLNPIFIVISSLVFMYSCEKNNTDSSDPSGNFFPLKIGNLWQYDYVFNEVKGTTLIDGKEYFLVEEKLSGVMNTYYVRIDNAGNVYRKLVKDKPEGLYLKVNLKAGDSWQYIKWTGGDRPEVWNCMVRSVNTDVKYEGNLFENCYQVDYDVADMIDEEHTKYFAPNVGHVKTHSYMWNNSVLLSRSVINGKETIYLKK